MSDIAKHLLVAVKAAGSVISEVDPGSVKLSPDVKRMIDRAGAIHPQIAVNLTAEPVIEFTTSDITLISALTAISAENPVGLYFRALTDTEGFGSGYISVVATSGLAEPVSIQAQRGETAKLTVRLHLASSDGDTDPLTVGTSSETIAVPSSYYTIGELTLGSAVGSVQETTLNFGYQLTKDTGENGAPYPKQIYCDEQQAQIQATSRALAFATQARLLKGSNETTVTLEYRLCSSAALPLETGGYRVTGQKANVIIPTLSGGRPASTIDITADLIATSFAGTNYLQFATISA